MASSKILGEEKVADGEGERDANGNANQTKE